MERQVKLFSDNFNLIVVVVGLTGVYACLTAAGAGSRVALVSDRLVLAGTESFVRGDRVETDTLSMVFAFIESIAVALYGI